MGTKVFRNWNTGGSTEKLIPINQDKWRDIPERAIIKNTVRNLRLIINTKFACGEQYSVTLSDTSRTLTQNYQHFTTAFI